MEDKDKKKICGKIVWKIFLALLFGFFALYISEATGYYEFEQHKKVALTEEKIKQFENDVNAGKDIKITDYINEREVSYENNTSSLGLALSDCVENVVKDGIETTFNFLNRLFNG